jgi:TolB-like protein/tetratricopeptide (TPR) repeat protein
VDDIVRRCLARHPRARWQTAHETESALRQVLTALAPGRAPAPLSTAAQARQWAAGAALAAMIGVAVWVAGIGSLRTPGAAAEPIRSLAVLPLDDLSGDPEQEYFADGVTDQLIADLAGVSALRVISRTSVMRYRRTQTPVPAIARELHVDAVIEGSAVRTGDTVRIVARLIRGGTGEIVWARSYERGMRDVVILQREVARAITAEVGVTVTPQEQARLGNERPVDPETHRLVLLGLHHAGKSTEDGLRKAIEFFESALAREPENARAHAGLADAYVGLNGFYLHPQEVMPRAKHSAETAIRFDESLAEAYATLGFIHLVYDWNGPAAEKALLRALEINPALATARLHYAAYPTTQARNQEAVREIRRAVEFDPLSIRAYSLGANLLVFTRDYEEAIELGRKGLELEPNSAFILAFQGVAYAQLGRFADGVANMKRAETLDGSPTILALEAVVFGLAGQKDAARAVIHRLEETARNRYFCPYEIGAAYATIGEAGIAYDWFREGIKGRADCMAWLGVEPWMDAFRADPRYRTLLEEIGLTPSPPRP